MAAAIGADLIEGQVPFVQRVSASRERDRSAVEAIKGLVRGISWLPSSNHIAPLRAVPATVDVSSAYRQRRLPMPVVDYGQYCEMLDRARKGRFAYPAINVTSLTTANAVLKGTGRQQERRDHPGLDRRRRVRVRAPAVKDMALGAISIAEHVHRVGGAVSDLRGAPHGPLPGGQAGRVRDAARRGDRAAAGGGQTEPVQQPHVRRQRAAAHRTTSTSP